MFTIVIPNELVSVRFTFFYVGCLQVCQNVLSSVVCALRGVHLFEFSYHLLFMGHWHEKCFIQ